MDGRSCHALTCLSGSVATDGKMLKLRAIVVRSAVSKSLSTEQDCHRMSCT